MIRTIRNPWLRRPLVLLWLLAVAPVILLLDLGATACASLDETARSVRRSW